MSGQHYDAGREAGAEKARAELLDNRKIAGLWAKRRLQHVEAHTAQDDYGLGYLDGYRATLAEAAKQL